MKKKDRVNRFIEYFSKNLPEAKTELEYNNAFELTVAVVLSAQCTDKRVNIITKNLFKKIYNRNFKFFYYFLLTIVKVNVRKYVK